MTIANVIGLQPGPEGVLAAGPREAIGNQGQHATGPVVAWILVGQQPRPTPAGIEDLPQAQLREEMPHCEHRPPRAGIEDCDRSLFGQLLGIVHEYVRVVTSIRENGRVKQRVVANLGRRDTLETILPLLERFLRGDSQQEQLAKQLAEEGPIAVLDASTWGPMLAVRHFFAQLGLWQVLDAGRRWPRLLPDENPDDDWPSRVLALIANRLTRPGSEHALGAGWRPITFAIVAVAYVPCWKRQGRVQISLTQLQYWYRTLDHLLLNKDQIEVALYQRLRDLFDFQPDLVFYDLTSSYFAGHGPDGFAKHGYSRDGKPRNVQVVVGVVLVAGWPIAHHVWAGNMRDSKTVPEVVADLSKRFAFRQVVFVGDRGMVTEKNLQVLQKAEGAWGFLVGMTRRQNPEAETLIDRVDESRWIDCQAGITAAEKNQPPRTRVQEVCAIVRGCGCSWLTATSGGPTNNACARR